MTLSDGPHRVRRLGWKLAAVAIAMFGFGYALVPLYQVYCRVTGFSGSTDRISANAALTRVVAGNRLVTVEFVASTSDNLPWEFSPVEPQVSVHPGQLVLARFRAHNISPATIIGQAVPSVTPNQAAPYFHKVQCFCFTRQTLGPGENRDLAVQFVVDPELPPDIATLTLSYTFFSTPGVMVRGVPSARRTLL